MHVEKAEKVARILYKNKQQLIDFLQDFKNDDPDVNHDEFESEFIKEKKYLIKKISEMSSPKPAKSSTTVNTNLSSATVAAQTSVSQAGVDQKNLEIQEVNPRNNNNTPNDLNGDGVQDSGNSRNEENVPH